MPTKKGPFTVMGRFNSTRSPENIYVVKKHHEVDKDSDKHLSCSCLGWRFSPKRYGNHTCPHVRYVEEHGHGMISEVKYQKSEISRATRRAKRGHDDPKTILATACQSAGIHLGDYAFRELLKALKPHLSEQAVQVSPSTDTGDDVLRVITLD